MCSPLSHTTHLDVGVLVLEQDIRDSLGMKTDTFFI